jgi:sugar phosphate isomerase/epimerase
MRIGAKTSVQPQRRGMIERLVEDGIADFIEVYVTKDRMPSAELKKICDSWVVHGPHVGHGVRFPDLTESAAETFKDSIRLASDLGARYVITHIGGMHPGSDMESGYSKAVENILMMKDFAKDFGVELLMENLIYKENYVVEIGLEKTHDWNFCSKPDDVRRLLKDVKCGLLMDFAHAIVTSHNMGADHRDVLKEILDLEPVMFHVCDGRFGVEKDGHMNLGRGDYDIKSFFGMIGDSDVTLEIASDRIPVFEDFKESVDYLRSIGVLN